MIFACGLKSGSFGSVISTPDGTTWSDGSLPGTPRGFYAIHGSADNNVYMAGRGGTHHFDGATWSFEELFGSFDTQNGLWVSPDGTKVYLVTEKRSTHKISGVWTEGSNGFVNRNCLWGFNPAANEIYAGYRGIDPTNGAGINQYDGVGDYFDIYLVHQAGSYIGFNGIWGTGPNALWTVTGYDFNNPHPSRLGYIYKWNGATLSLEHTTAAGEALFAVHGVDASNIWAVGANGTILYYNGSTWTPQVSGTTAVLNAVWAVSATEVWAGGGWAGVPTLLRYNGVSWSPVDVSSTNIIGIYGLYGSGVAAPPSLVERPSYDITQIISPENGDGEFASCIDASGDWLVVGNGGSGSNDVKVYKRNAAGQYEYHQVLEPPFWATIPPVSFGAQVAIDGDYLAVSDPDSPATNPSVPGIDGLVSTWKYSSGNDLWNYNFRMSVPQIEREAARFGWRLAMAHGYAIVVDELAIEPISGEVRGAWAVFRLDADIWQMEQTEYGSLLNVKYGSSVHIAADNQFWVSYPCGSGIAKIERWDYDPGAIFPTPKWSIGQQIVAPTETGEWGGASVDAFFLVPTHYELLVTDPANGQIYVHSLPSGAVSDTRKLVEPQSETSEYSADGVGNIAVFDPAGAADLIAVSGKFCAFTFDRVGGDWVFNGPVRMHIIGRVDIGKDGLVFLDDGTLLLGSTEEGADTRGYVLQCARSATPLVVAQPTNNTDLGHLQNAAADGDWAVVGQPYPEGLATPATGFAYVLHKNAGALDLHTALEGPPSQLWTSFLPPSGGIFFSQDKARTAWDSQASDALWIGTGKVFGINESRIVANVGYYDIGPPIVGYPVAVFDGVDWVVDTDLDVPWSKTSGVWCSADEILITCHKDSPGDRTWRRKSGGSWSIIETLAAGKWFEDLSGVSNSAVYACGGTVAGNAHWVRMWDGGSVSQVYTSSTAGYPKAIFALATDKIWYAWEDDATGNVVIEFWNGATWATQYNVSHGGAAIVALFALDDTHVWAVCDGPGAGPVLFFNGTAWAVESIPTITGTTLFGVHASSAKDVYVTGNGVGRLLHFDGTDWNDITPATWVAENLAGIFSEMIRFYGKAVYLNNERIVVAGPEPGVGRVFVYDYVVGTDSWDLTATIESESLVVTEQFGSAVAIDETGDTIAVVGYLGDNSHRVQVFFLDVTWLLQEELYVDPYNERDVTIGLAEDALAIGAPKSGSGKIDFYKRSDGVWSMFQEIVPPAGSHANEQFGNSIDMSGPVLAVSSAFWSGGGVHKSGKLYVYHPTWLGEYLYLKALFEDPQNVPYSLGAYSLGSHVSVNGGLVICGDGVCFRETETDGVPVDRGGRGLVVGWDGAKWRALGSVAQRWDKFGQVNLGFSVASDGQFVLACAPNESLVGTAEIYGWDYGAGFDLGPIIGPSSSPLIIPIDPLEDEVDVSTDKVINFDVDDDGVLVTPWIIKIDRGNGVELMLTYDGVLATFEPGFDGPASSLTPTAGGYSIFVEAPIPWNRSTIIRLFFYLKDLGGKPAVIA